MATFARIAAVVALASSLATARSTPGSPEPVVTIQLLADSTRIVPGNAFGLVVRFEIPKGWHIYWKNPGDSGLATDVRVRGPEGFEIGEVAYPGPARFELPGGVVSFGYENETALFVRVVAPKTLEPGARATFTAAASWLACKEACVPGEAEATIEMRVRDAATPADPANAALLEPHRRLLPRPWKDLAAVDVAWGGSPSKPSVTFSSTKAESLELFPDRATYACLDDRSIESRSGVRATYRFTFDGRARPESLSGVLAVNENGKPTYYDARFPWPK